MSDPICSCHTPLRSFLTKGPVVFALELVVAALISCVLGWAANRFSRKENRQAQALERMAASLESFGHCKP